MSNLYPSSRDSPNGGPRMGVALDRSQRMELWKNLKERELWDDMADFYGVIRATELLEAAYARGAVEPDKYTNVCKSLISSFGIQEQVLQSRGAIKDGAAFIEEYAKDATRAKIRLITEKIPATAQHVTPSWDSKQALIFDATNALIQASDSVSLQMTRKGDLHPLLVDVLDSINKLGVCRDDHPTVQTTKKWLQYLEPLRASDELTSEDAEQLTMEFGNALRQFRSTLEQ
eukprot:gb/GECG01016825.1/.p1 GENE.gb/GECG01016825.1/~~gb/GECG01016825.1/.p1  ORF type:complete len:231 (+),score=29.13 gb/GECG01016825.1/:1-693(+)